MLVSNIMVKKVVAGTTDIVWPNTVIWRLKNLSPKFEMTENY